MPKLKGTRLKLHLLERGAANDPAMEILKGRSMFLSPQYPVEVKVEPGGGTGVVSLEQEGLSGLAQSCLPATADPSTETVSSSTDPRSGDAPLSLI